MMYEYYVNLDERGEFYADLRRSEDGVTIWEIHTEDLAELVEDGFIKHGNDLDGILEYCVMHNIIRSTDVIVKG